MFNWIANHWWLFWGAGCSGALIAFRLRRTPSDDPTTGKHRSIVTRIVAPDGRKAKRIPLMFLLLGVGLVTAFAVIGLVNFMDWRAAK
jgi:hypothetical protein